MDNYSLFKKWIEKAILRESLKTNFKRIGLYTEIFNNYKLFPAIDVNTEKQEIKISVDSVDLRRKLESYIDTLSTALPSRYLVKSSYFTKTQDYLVLKYEDTKRQNRLIFNRAVDLYDYSNSLQITELFLDKNTTINLKETPHLLLTGGTGSGKSYLAQCLILQGLCKNWDIHIIDYKRSYQSFKGACKVAFTITEITKMLDDAIEELHNRQKEMDELLKSNPGATAIDKGCPVYFVVIEEYLALVHSGADKKILQKIESQILEIATLGRALNVNLLMIMQVSSASSLNTSIRANLPFKAVMGNANRTVLETAFGVGAQFPRFETAREIGEGIACKDVTFFTFKAPTLQFDIVPMLQVFVVNRAETP